MVTVEATPNPETLKFLISQEAAPGGIATGEPLVFDNIEKAKDAPLVNKLLGIEGVKSVFLGKNFISITKTSSIQWDHLRAPVLTVLKDFFAMGDPIFTRPTQVASDLSDQHPKNDVEQDICALLDERIRPFVAQDGGDIVFERFENGVVYLKMHGACSGCPSAKATLKQGLEKLLKHFIPGVERVEPV